MTTSEKRNRQGAWVAFALGLLLSGLGVIIMLRREVIQRNKGGFPLETDDVVKYTTYSGIGAFVNFLVMLAVAVC